MALKMKDTGGMKPPSGVSYAQHLNLPTHHYGKATAPPAQAKPITGMTSTEKTVGGVPLPSGIEESETVHPGVLTDGMAITVEGGRTINLGNYESARIGVSVTVPCDKDTLNDAYEFATEWVSGKIVEAITAVKGEG
jgi:hypothetical protein